MTKHQLADLISGEPATNEWLHKANQLLLGRSHDDFLHNLKVLGIEPEDWIFYNYGSFQVKDPRYAVTLALILSDPKNAAQPIEKTAGYEWAEEAVGIMSYESKQNPIERKEVEVDYHSVRVTVTLEKFSPQAGHYPVAIGNWLDALDPYEGWIVSAEGKVIGQMNENPVGEIDIAVFTPNIERYLSVKIKGINRLETALYNMVNLFDILNPDVFQEA